MKGLYVKCKNCSKTFWVELKLSFGLRTRKEFDDLLECFLDETRFYFKCYYCKKPTIVGINFFSNKQPEITHIIENPNYIG